jgi:hypothetical protein
MNTARLLAWLVLPIVGLVLVGSLALWLLHALVHLVVYLVVGGGVYLYARAKRAIGPGTRNRRRIEAAAETYRMRKGR